MSEKSLAIPVQYVLSSSVETLVRPYEAKSPVQNSFSLWLDVEPVPQDNHWRLVVEAEVLGKTQDGALCAVATCAIEGIVVVGGLTKEEADAVVRAVAAPSIIGSVRTLLASITQGTGLGTVVLPPLANDQIAKLPSKSQEQPVIAGLNE